MSCLWVVPSPFGPHLTPNSHLWLQVAACMLQRPHPGKPLRQAGQTRLRGDTGTFKSRSFSGTACEGCVGPQDTIQRAHEPANGHRPPTKPNMRVRRASWVIGITRKADEPFNWSMAPGDANSSFRPTALWVRLFSQELRSRVPKTTLPSQSLWISQLI